MKPLSASAFAKYLSVSLPSVLEAIQRGRLKGAVEWYMGMWQIDPELGRKLWYGSSRPRIDRPNRPGREVTAK